MNLSIRSIYPLHLGRQIGIDAEKNVQANFDELLQRLRAVPSLKSYFTLGLGATLELASVDFVVDEQVKEILINLDNPPERTEVLQPLVDMIADTAYATFDKKLVVKVLDLASKKVLTERRCREHRLKTELHPADA